MRVTADDEALARVTLRSDLGEVTLVEQGELEVALLDGKKEVDRVSSYFGVRQIEVKPDAKGLPRLMLNGEELFQMGPLDQGFWPEGIYTAPTDAALKYDIEITKKLGYNMTRVLNIVGVKPLLAAIAV